MKTINNIAVFDSDKYFLAMFKGYCYANNISMTEVEFNRDGINEVAKLKPDLIVVPLALLSTANKSLETGLLKRAGATGKVKICGLNKDPANIISAGLSGWIDVIINYPFDIGEIDGYLKKTFLWNSRLTEKRSHKERRSLTDRRSIESNSDGNDGYIETRNPGNQNPGNQHEAGNPVFKDFQIDQRNKCVFLKGNKVDLTPKEFELFELLSTDVDRIFMADEIIKHLWPENNRATKSDLYQYMHLLRKKIEEDPNNPQWIMTIKGFGYKLNIGNSEEIQQGPSRFLGVTYL
ncbi:MAG: winged helix-turn-helix domain-containing protein [Methylococcaceae bacterium]|jgi:DNA-binding response OmpR family regulator|nr:winged helix-turn-helix domain-containing protein [Methylococcaceae bacterium]OYV19293.1 MAG: two component transcriptional regulator, winged helix family [Methylococcaceae bacterium NSM2-1]